MPECQLRIHNRAVWHIGRLEEIFISHIFYRYMEKDERLYTSLFLIFRQEQKEQEEEKKTLYSTYAVCISRVRHRIQTRSGAVFLFVFLQRVFSITRQRKNYLDASFFLFVNKRNKNKDCWILYLCFLFTRPQCSEYIMINYHIVFFNQDSVKTAYRTSMCILPFFTAQKTTVKDILQQAARTWKKIFISHRFFQNSDSKRNRNCLRQRLCCHFTE